jgi:hypothetical protein
MLMIVGAEVSGSKQSKLRIIRNMSSKLLIYIIKTILLYHNHLQGKSGQTRKLCGARDLRGGRTRVAQSS